MSDLCKVTAVLVLALCVCCPSVALAGEDPHAVALWGRINQLLDDNNYKEACLLAVDMAPYKGSETYVRVEQKLLQRGISISSPLQSYTIKQIVAVQNEAEHSRLKTEMLPRLGPRENYKDAWGMPLRVEFVSNSGFLYLVRSAGPDKRFLTDDDLVIGTRGEKHFGGASEDGGRAPSAAGKDSPAMTQDPLTGETAKAASASASAGPRDLGRDSLYHGQKTRPASNQPSGSDLMPGRKTADPSEREITLDELKEVIGN